VWDVDNTQATQVYRGASVEYPTSDRALGATRGEIRTYGGAAAFTEFSASNGGWRAAGDAPYLTAAEDDYETARTPFHDWTAAIPAAKVEAAHPEVGDLQDVVVTERDASGRAVDVTISGSAGSVPMTGTAFATAFGLRSTLFDLSLS
jgi:SpoIID/LytB domain protein